MTSHSDAAATDGNRAAAAGTVATTGDSIGDGAVATVGTDGTDDTVIDGTVADTGTVKKQNFHTGLDPVSRENNCAQRTLSAASPTTALNSVGCAEFFVLDTGSSPVWSVVVDADTNDNDCAVVSTVVSGGDSVGDGAVATRDADLRPLRKVQRHR